VLRAFGFPVSGNGYNAVRRRVASLAVDTGHWRRNKPCAPRSLAAMLTAGVWISNRSRIKPRLVAAGLLANACALCGQRPRWKRKPLVLILDHINGVPDDYRAENLRLLCPNCNSQQATFSGRNAKRNRRAR